MKVLCRLLIITLFVVIMYQTIVFAESTQISANRDYFTFLKDEHPRIQATSEDFDKIKNSIHKDPNLEKWYEEIKNNTDNLLKRSCIEYSGRVLPDARESIRRLSKLGLLYNVTGESRYAHRGWKEIKSIIVAPSMKGIPFLHVAEVSYALGLGYDWFYDYLSEQQRKDIRDQLVERCLIPALNGYKINHKDWVIKYNNWNAVCNGGIGVGALAIGNDDPQYKELVYKLLDYGIVSVQNALSSLNPDGGWYEGPGYWAYTLRYFSRYIGSLDTALGTDFNLSKLKGFSQTGYFGINMTAYDKRQFIYSDGSSRPVYNMDGMLWLADKFNNSDYASWYVPVIDSNPTAYTVLSYDPDSYTPLKEDTLDLDRYFSGPEVAVFRNSWLDPNSIFTGIRSGENGRNHGHLEKGTFYLNAFGTEWTAELGKGDYNWFGYHQKGTGGYRWNYYVTRAEGHNTIVINPGKGPDQYAEGKAEITKYQNNSNEAFAITDLTPLNPGTESVKRGLRFFDNRTKVLVQDEIKTPSESDIWWFMHTKSDINIGKDGNTAVLSDGQNKLLARIVSPCDAEFNIMDAAPLISSPDPEEQKGYTDGVKKLSIHLKGVKEETLAVLLVPLRGFEDIPSNNPKITPLDKWNISNDTYVYADSISINSKVIKNFQSDRFSYDINLPGNATSVPNIDVDAKDSYIVNIKKPSYLPGVVKVKVTSERAGCKETTYRIYLNKDGYKAKLQNNTDTMLDKISFSSDKQAIRSGESIYTLLEGTMTNGTKMDINDASVRYLSMDESIITVDENGTVTGTGNGEADVNVEVTLNRMIKTGRITFKVSGEPTYKGAFAIKGSPTIDGAVEDLWDICETYKLEKYKNGSADKNAKAEFKTMWDEDNLYFLVTVKDKILSTKGEKPWFKDSIEIYVDEGNEKSKDGWDTNDGQYRIDVDNEFTHNTRKGGGYDQRTLVHTVQKTEDGYILEVKFPWVIKKEIVKAGSTIGLEMQINDDSQGEGEKDGVARWSSTLPNKTTENWETVILIESSRNKTIYQNNKEKDLTIDELKTKLRENHENRDKRIKLVRLIVEQKKEDNNFDGISVFVKGIDLQSDTSPVIKQGRMLMPVRAVTEALGAVLQWNPKTFTATISKNKTVIVMNLDTKVVTVNEKEVELDVPPQIINNRTLVPVRFIAETFNLDVQWDEKSRSAIIEEKTSSKIPEKISVSESTEKSEIASNPKSKVQNKEIVLISDDFESGSFDTNEWNIRGIEIQSNETNSGDYSVVYNDYGRIVKFIDTSGKTELVLKASYKTVGFEPNDKFRFQWHDGDSWHVPLQVQEDNDWNDIVIKLPEEAENNPDFRLRVNSSISTEEGKAFLDDIILTASSTE